MSNAELSVLNDHDSTNHLSHTETSQNLTLQLHYNDRREGLEKLIKNVEFPSTATIRDVINELIERCQLKHKRPEDISLIEITHDKRYSVPVENAHMTLHELSIGDGCTLGFQPSPTSVAEEPLYLTIWPPGSIDSIRYKWYKTSTTVGMLLEHVIQALSLESLQRERIHLFHIQEEIDLASNYDNLLAHLDIRDNTFIDVAIIPPITPPISLSSTSTYNGVVSSFSGESNISRLSHSEFSSPMKLELEYTDRYLTVTTVVSDQFLPSTIFDDLIKEFLKLGKLEHLNSNNVNLVAFSIGGQRHAVSAFDRYKTLKELAIEDGCILHLESSFSYTPIVLFYLTIVAPNSVKKDNYKWSKTSTTLGILFEDIIKVFFLQSIERKRIRLTTISDEELDHTLHFDKLLTDLGVANCDTIYVKIIDSYASSNVNKQLNIHVECCYTNGNQSFEVPYTITIEELRKEIEKRFKDHLVTEIKLLDRMHDPMDMSNMTQKLSDLGIEPGQMVYARLQLVYSRNPLSKLNMGHDTTITRSSLVVKQEPDAVTINCKTSTSNSTMIKASANDTVAELLKKLEIFKKDRPLAQWDMYCGSNKINTERVNQCLFDFGVRAGDTIDATLIEKIPVKYALENSRGSTSLTIDNLSRSQRSTSTPMGLANFGNTCYMNSALQCLAHTKPLTQFFLDGLTQNTSDDDKGLDPEWNQFYTIGTVTGAYADVLRNLFLPSKSSYSLFTYRPERIKETIGLQAPRFATYDQQDAQEFMTYLLDEIHKELKENTGSESNTIIEELFFGKIQSTVTCSECQHQVKTTNIISFLPLPLNQHGRIFYVKFIGKEGDNDFAAVRISENGQVKSIVQAYAEARPSQHFFNTIIVMTDDGPLDIELPLSELHATEVMLIEQNDFLGSVPFDQMFKTSKSLTLDGCLQDFCSIESLEDSWSCQQETCKKHTKATKQLQFASLPPILIIQFKRFSHEDGLREKIETFVDYPTEGLNLKRFLLPPEGEEEDDDAIYDLFAVSNHIGSIYGGHYTAYAQHELYGKNEWHKFDDAYTSQFYYKNDIVSKDAYLLFYIKRDKPKQSTAVTTS